MTKDFLGWPVKIVAGGMRSNAKWIFGPPVSIGEHLMSTERDTPKRCGNCTHWGREPAGRHRSVPGFGDCTRVLHHVGDDESRRIAESIPGKNH